MFGNRVRITRAGRVLYRRVVVAAKVPTLAAWHAVRAAGVHGRAAGQVLPMRLGPVGLQRRFVYLVGPNVIARCQAFPSRGSRMITGVSVDRRPAWASMSRSTETQRCHGRSRPARRQSVHAPGGRLAGHTNDCVRVRLEVEPPRWIAFVETVHRQRDEVRTVFDVADDDAALLTGRPSDAREPRTAPQPRLFDVVHRNRPPLSRYSTMNTPGRVHEPSRRVLRRSGCRIAHGTTSLRATISVNQHTSDEYAMIPGPAHPPVPVVLPAACALGLRSTGWPTNEAAWSHVRHQNSRSASRAAKNGTTTSVVTSARPSCSSIAGTPRSMSAPRRPLPSPARTPTTLRRTLRPRLP